MKKNYFMMATAATMLAACTQTDFVNEIPAEAPKAIQFENGFVNKSTRSENSSSNYTLTFSDHHNSFAVWGYKNVSDEAVFNKKTVNVTLGSGAGSEIYQYDGLVYWDESATSYQFYAAAPAGHDWYFTAPTEADKSNGYFTTSVALDKSEIHNDAGAHLTVLGDDNDLLIAAPCSPVIGETVELEFIHILSRLNIVLSKKSGMAEEVKSYEVSVKNMKLSGDFNEGKEAANNATGSYARWENQGTIGDYQATRAEGAEVQAGVERHVIQTLVVPQAAEYESIAINGSDASSATAPYLYVRYGVENGTKTEMVGGVETTVKTYEIFEKYYNLAQIFGVTSGSSLAFNEGWENTLTLTIGPASIDFKATVATWAVDSKKQNSLN